MIPTPSNLRSLRAAWQAHEGLHREEIPRRPCFEVSNSGQLSRLYVTGLIGGYDNDATEFVQAVHGITAKTIDLHVNSPGGFVWDGLAMYAALKDHPATVTAHVDGLAASAASFLIQAADHRVMATGSRGMVHDAQVVAFGSPAEVREAADLGDAVSDDIASIYAERAGGKPAAWRKAMTATTWYSAQQMVDAGLADRVATKQSGPDNRSRLITARVRALATREG